MVAKDRTAGFQDVCRYVYRGYIGILLYILGLYRDNGKENGNYPQYIYYNPYITPIYIFFVGIFFGVAQSRRR